MYEAWQYINGHWAKLGAWTLEHLWLILISNGIAVLIGVSLSLSRYINWIRTRFFLLVFNHSHLARKKTTLLSDFHKSQVVTDYRLGYAVSTNLLIKDFTLLLINSPVQKISVFV